MVAVKTGDTEQFTKELMKNSVEVRDVTDSNAFDQNLIFTAAQIANENSALDMLKILVSLGVDMT